MLVEFPENKGKMEKKAAWGLREGKRDKETFTDTRPLRLSHA